jgi:hypothetical protein
MHFEVPCCPVVDVVSIAIDLTAPGSAAEPAAIDPLLTAQPASLSTEQVAALQARLADFAQLDAIETVV